MEFTADPVSVCLALSCVVVLIVYRYLTSGLNYWEKAGIPYFKPKAILGNVGDILRNPQQDIEMKRYKEKGRIYGTYEGKNPVLTVADPDIIRDLLVKDFQFFTSRRAFETGEPAIDNMVSVLKGEKWKRVRALMSPAFSTGRIKKMTGIFMDCAKTCAKNFRNAAEERKPVDMKRYFSAFTMDVIASAAFGTKIDSHNDPENAFVRNAKVFFTRNGSIDILLFFVFPSLLKIVTYFTSGRGPMKFFKDAVVEIVEERRKSGTKRNDFLQLMMDAVKESEEPVDDSKDDHNISDIGHEENNSQIFKQAFSTKSLSNDELVAQCVLFFIAGFDTTASTLTFAAYELALNPDVQDQLIAEVDETIKEKGELSYEAVSEMAFLNCVVSETLRKYPPAVRTERTADQDYQIESNGIKIAIPKGMIVGVPIYAMHHDPDFYPEPAKFNPERFSTEEKAARHPYTFLPFGAGPRNCLAMRFALIEVKVCLAYLLSQCRLRTCAETKVPLEYYYGQSLLQPKKVDLKLEARNV